MDDRFIIACKLLNKIEKYSWKINKISLLAMVNFL
jgi:hypothetical protein